MVFLGSTGLTALAVSQGLLPAVMVEGAAGLEGFFLEHFYLFVASGILGVLVVFMSSLEFSVLCVRALLLACDGFGVCFTSSTLGGLGRVMLELLVLLVLMVELGAIAVRSLILRPGIVIGVSESGWTSNLVASLVTLIGARAVTMCLVSDSGMCCLFLILSASMSHSLFFYTSALPSVFSFIALSSASTILVLGTLARMTALHSSKLMKGCSFLSSSRHSVLRGVSRLV